MIHEIIDWINPKTPEEKQTHIDEEQLLNQWDKYMQKNLPPQDIVKICTQARRNWRKNRR